MISWGPVGKIFVIGFHKTGTLSITQALTRLGFKTAHSYGPYLDQIREGVRRGDFRFPFLSAFNAFTDAPFSGIYRQLDRAFPDAKFILTIRDSREWWESLVKHKRRDGWVDKPLGLLEELQYNQFPPVQTVFRIQDRDIFISKFSRHRQEVLGHFAGRRGKLLAFDVTRETSEGFWGALSRFLGRGPVSGPIPWVNRSS